jgi:4-hydroxy-4-methyl-2-oxoglutarate aldolase
MPGPRLGAAAPGAHDAGDTRRKRGIVAENDIIARLGRLDSCALSDAMDKLGLPPALSFMPPRTIRGRIAGRVMTVRLAEGPSPPGTTPRHLCSAAIEAAQPGDILLIQHIPGLDAGGWGGILSRAAKARGLAGVITDGAARDIDEATEIAFPVFAAATTARTARGRLHEAETGGPVTLGGVAAQPGDYALADGSGVVLVAARDIMRVLDAAEMIAAREAAMARDVEAGKPVSQVMGADYEHMLQR